MVGDGAKQRHHRRHNKAQSAQQHTHSNLPTTQQKQPRSRSLLIDSTRRCNMAASHGSGCVSAACSCMEDGSCTTRRASFVSVLSGCVGAGAHQAQAGSGGDGTRQPASAAVWRLPGPSRALAGSPPASQGQPPASRAGPQPPGKAQPGTRKKQAIKSQ